MKSDEWISLAIKINLEKGFTCQDSMPLPWWIRKKLNLRFKLSKRHRKQNSVGEKLQLSFSRLFCKAVLWLDLTHEHSTEHDVIEFTPVSCTWRTHASHDSKWSTIHIAKCGSFRFSFQFAKRDNVHQTLHTLCSGSHTIVYVRVHVYMRALDALTTYVNEFWIVELYLYI